MCAGVGVCVWLDMEPSRRVDSLLGTVGVFSCHIACLSTCMCEFWPQVFWVHLFLLHSWRRRDISCSLRSTNVSCKRRQWRRNREVHSCKHKEHSCFRTRATRMASLCRQVVSAGVLEGSTAARRLQRDPAACTPASV